jgi:hypothetical protein
MRAERRKMPDGRFEALKLELQEGGVSPVYVERTLLELEEHYADLTADALAAGMSRAEAERTARAALGSDRTIASAVLALPELREWRVRYPRVAYCMRSAATIGLIPGVPVMFCIEHRPEVTRWTAAVLAAATFIAAVLTLLDWLIFVPV